MNLHLDKDAFLTLMEEELGRLDGIPKTAPSEFVFFTQTESDANVRRAYDVMQRQYVLRSCDRIEFDAAVFSIKDIQSRLSDNPAWIKQREF